MRPEDYMLDTDGDCSICIAEDSSIDQIILGSGFLRGFYSTHDLYTNRFGFAAHATSTKADPRYGTQPDRYLPGIKEKEDKKSGLTAGQIAAIVVSCVVVALAALAIGIWAIWYFTKDDNKGTRKNMSKYQVIFI